MTGQKGEKKEEEKEEKKEKEEKNKENCRGRDDIEGSIRGPHGPKKNKDNLGKNEFNTRNNNTEEHFLWWTLLLYLAFCAANFLFISRTSPKCACILYLFFCNLTFVSTPVYFRYVASLCVLAVVGFLGSDLTTPGPRCEVFDDDDEVRCELVFIGPESDHWLCLSLTDSLPFRKLD